MHNILMLLFIIIFNACEKKSLNHEVIFKGQLGVGDSQIGSNIPILESYTNRQGFPDSLLIDVPYIKIFNQQVYIADSYNKKISVFSIEKDSTPNKQLLLSIPNKGKNYQFARPYDLWVNNKNEIFVLASIQDMESYEVQNYNNQTAEIQNYNKFEQQLKKIPNENFYIFQFSKEGKYIRTLGINGINSSPMIFPSYINGDNLGNFYIGFVQITNNQRQTIVKQFDINGQFKTEFDSSSLTLDTNINQTNYQGTILSINNFKKTEKLALVVEYQPIIEIAPSNSTFAHQILSSIITYDLAEKKLDNSLLELSNSTESILDIDNQDRIFLQSFDTKYHALKIRVLEDSNQSTVYHTPVESSYYTLFNYFIDEKGNLYNYLINRKTDLLVLKWHTEQEK